MNCPKCGSDRVTNAGVLPSGSERYQCLACKKKFVPKPKGKGGRKPIEDERMSNAEYCRRYRAKKLKPDSG